jgi:ParB family chromosome partitioning protein
MLRSHHDLDIKTQSQARELSRVEPHDRGRVLEKAKLSANTNKPTAHDVRRAACAHAGEHNGSDINNVDTAAEQQRDQDPFCEHDTETTAAPLFYDSDDKCTPQDIVDACRLVMCKIHIDPASCQAAQDVIKADRYETAETDGLRGRCNWIGNVWLNPPYSTPLVDRFVEKLRHEISEQHTKQACVLTNNCTETGWFHDLVDVSSAVLFFRGRVAFWRPGREKKTFGRRGQTLFYFGPNVDDFCRELGWRGWVVEV